MLGPIIKAVDLERYRTCAWDYEETQVLLRGLAKLRRDRMPFYLDMEVLDRICHWKLGRQYGRVRRHLERLTDRDVESATRQMFLIEGRTAADTAVDRMRCVVDAGRHKLAGVGIGVASAILALTEPDRFCVIDFRGWRAIFGERRDAFWYPEYRRYLNAITALARQLGWTPQETDLAAWAWDDAVNGHG